MPLGMIALYFFASLLTAGILIYAHLLSRKYLQDFLSFYYFYLLISCSLAVLGKPLPTLVISTMKLKGLQAEQFMLIFNLLLAKPLWILSIYFLTKCIVALVRKKLSRVFTSVYFLFWTGFLLFQLIFTIQFFKTGVLTAGFQTFNDINGLLEISATLLIFGYGISQAGRIKSQNQKTEARIFSSIGFLSKAIFWVLIFMNFSFTIPFLFNVALPIPALIYLGGFLKRSSWDYLGHPDNAAEIESVLARFKITPREREIISHICFGQSNKEIAEILFISIHTVKRHVNQIYQKLGIKNRIQLANLIRESTRTDSNTAEL